MLLLSYRLVWPLILPRHRQWPQGRSSRWWQWWRWWWIRSSTWWVRLRPGWPGCSWEVVWVSCSEPWRTTSERWWGFRCRSGRTYRRREACTWWDLPNNTEGSQRDFWQPHSCWTWGCRSSCPRCHWARFLRPKSCLVAFAEASMDGECQRCARSPSSHQWFKTTPYRQLMHPMVLFYTFLMLSSNRQN